MFHSHKIKQILLFIIAITSLMMCVSCQRETPDTGGKYNTYALPTGSYLLTREESVIYPYDGKLYAGSAEQAGFGYYDLSNGMQYTLLADVPVTAICVNEAGIYLFSDASIIHMTTEGEVLASYPVHDGTEEIKSVELYASAGMIVAILNDGTSHTAILVDEANGTQERDALTSAYTVRRVYAITGDRATYSLLCSYTDALDFVRYGLFTYRPHSTLDTVELEFVTEVDGEMGFDMVGEEIYTVDSEITVLQLMRSNGRGDKCEILKNIGMEYYLADVNQVSEETVLGFYCHKLFYAGNYYLIWDKKNHIVTIHEIRLQETDPTLTVLYPTDEAFDPLADDFERTVYTQIEYDMVHFENRADCAVHAMKYPITEFADRLTMKLLAGDDDFDVVYADRCDEGSILSAILNYGLYFPLENYAAITDQLDGVADGVVDFMTHNGHLIGSPYHFGGECLVVSPDFEETRLTLPDNWTVEAFFQLCEEAIPYCGDGVALCSPIYADILGAVVQNGIGTGAINRDEIAWAVEKLVLYTEKGVLANYREAPTHLLENIILPAQNSVVSETSQGRILPMPSYNGKKYAPLQSFVFINHKTKNEALAVQYLAMLFSPDFVSRDVQGKTYYAKDPQSYFTLAWSDSYGASEGEVVNAWRKEETALEDTVLYAAENTETLFVGYDIATMDSVSFRSFVLGIFRDLRKDVLDETEAIEEIYAYVRERYAE